MEGSTKDYSRAKYKLTKHRNHVHSGPGRGPGQGQATKPGNEKARTSQLQSNFDRYDSDSEIVEDGAKPRSEGLDLSKLLEMSALSVSTMQVRHWTMMSSLTTDAPPAYNAAEAFEVRHRKAHRPVKKSAAKTVHVGQQFL